MHSSTQHAALTGTKRMYRAFAQNDPEHRARRKLERAAARRRNDQNWGALWAAPAAAPDPELEEILLCPGPDLLVLT